MTRIRSGRFDEGDETADLLVLQGVEAEFLMNPSTPTPDWLTSLTASAANDVAVLPGAGAQGLDLALSIGPDGLLSHAWDRSSETGFSTSRLRAGSWLGGQLLEVIDEGATSVIAALSADGRSLLRARMANGQLSELPSVAIPTGPMDIDGFDWDGNGDLEIALRFSGLGCIVVNDLGEGAGSIPVPGADVRMAVPRSSFHGERDLLMAYALDPNLQKYVLLGACAGHYTNTVVTKDLGAYDMCCFDATQDGRDDVVLLLRETEGDASVRSDAVVYTRSGGLSPDPVALDRVDTLQLGSGSPTDVSVAMDVADFDNDGDQDLAFVSAHGRTLRVWHCDAIDEGAQVPDLGILQASMEDGAPDKGVKEARIDFSVGAPSAGISAGNIHRSDNVLIEVWRMNADVSAPVFEPAIHDRQIVPHSFWLDPTASADVSIAIVAGLSGNLDDHAFRIDVTLVTARHGEVVRRFTTQSTWYASDEQVMRNLEEAIGYWPYRAGTDPEKHDGDDGRLRRCCWQRPTEFNGRLRARNQDCLWPSVIALNRRKRRHRRPSAQRRARAKRRSWLPALSTQNLVKVDADLVCGDAAYVLTESAEVGFILGQELHHHREPLALLRRWCSKSGQESAGCVEVWVGAQDADEHVEILAVYRREVADGAERTAFLRGQGVLDVWVCFGEGTERACGSFRSESDAYRFEVPGPMLLWNLRS